TPVTNAYGQTTAKVELTNTQKDWLQQQLPSVDVKMIQELSRWLDAQTNAETGLVYSHVGDPRLKGWSVIYDDAMKTNANLLLLKIALVDKSFRYFTSRDGIWKYGGIINIVDASDPRAAGKGIEWIVHTGPNAFWGMVGAQAYLETGKSSYLEFAKSRADWVISLQNKDRNDFNYGGVRMGPRGENPQAQRINWDPKMPSFYELYCAEHNVDSYALFDMLYEITGEVKYKEARDLVLVWLGKVYDKKAHAFRWGTSEKDFLDTDRNIFVKAGIVPCYPLDANAWGISTIGKNALEALEPNAADKMYKFITDNYRVNISFTHPEGRKVTATLFDYVTHQDRKQLVNYVHDRADHKKAVSIGREPLGTPEWTNEVANAALRLFIDSFLGFNLEKAVYYKNEYRNILAELDKVQIKTPQGIAYPYAIGADEPQGVKANKQIGSGHDRPVGYGWNTPWKTEGGKFNLSPIGSSYRIMTALLADPLILGFGPLSKRKEIKVSELAKPLTQKEKEAKVLDESKIRTEAEDYVLAAWYRYQGGQWQEVIKIIEGMFRSHPDWVEIARKQQQEAAKLGYFPQASTEKELTPLYGKFWALYHLGTAHWQLMVAYDNLGNHQKALEHAKEIVINYSWAQCWDPKGWMWQMINSMKKEYPQLYREAMGQTKAKAPEIKPQEIKPAPVKEQAAPGALKPASVFGNIFGRLGAYGSAEGTLTAYTA
ncbi:MAG: hypothetical protein WAX79_06715, partial [Candidatus Omnitrophota bacterium]